VQSPLDFIFVRDFHGVSSYIAVARAVHRDPTATVFTRAACLLDPDDVSGAVILGDEDITASAAGQGRAPERCCPAEISRSAS
jgi:hypothetical protein